MLVLISPGNLWICQDLPSGLGWPRSLLYYKTLYYYTLDHSLGHSA